MGLNFVQVVHNLGAWFDSHFSMSTHISTSCSAAFFWLHNIKRISQFLPRDKLEMVLHAAGFPVFAAFKDELATRKSLKAFFVQPKL